MKIAVIGVGNVGRVLADKFAEAGHEVTVAASSSGSAEQAAEGMDCQPAANPTEAARDADVVVLAVPADAAGEIAAEIDGHVDGKPVIDVTNGPKSVSDGGSLAEELQRRLPMAHVVKAFNTAFASQMADPAKGTDRLDGFMAGDDAQAKAKVAGLVADVGFEPLDAGELKVAHAQAGRPPRGSVGLYHLAWETDSIEGLAEMSQRLGELGAMTGASDHGVSKSLYGRDPDGNEFEVMWQVPREAWGEYADQATVMLLDLDAELARWGAGASVQ